MATDEQRLVVSLEARINQLEKGMAKAAKTTDGAMDRIQGRSRRASRAIEQDFQRASRGVEASLNKVKSVATGALAGFSARQFVGEVRRATKAVAELNREAAKAGIGVESLQEFESVARRFNISQDALVDGFKELQLRADEFIKTGKGPGADAFKQLGLGADDLTEALRNPEGLFLDILERTRELDSEASRLRVFDEIFGGTGGEQLTTLLRTTNEEIARIREEARQSGAVISSQMVDRAVEVNQEFERLADTIEGRLQSALVSAGGAFFDFRDNALSALDDVFNRLNDIGNASFFERLNDWMRARDLIDGGALPEGTRILDGEGNTVRTVGPEPEADDGGVMDRRRQRMNDIWGGGDDDGLAGGMGSDTLAGGQARDMLAARAAHGNVAVGGLTEAAAAGAAAVLQRFPELRISSAYRSPEYNASVGGARGSRHVTGEAVDFVGYRSPEEAVEAMRMLSGMGFRGFGMYNNGSFHADMRPSPAAWGPDRTSGSLGQTPEVFQRFAEELRGQTDAARENAAAMQQAAAAQRQVGTAGAQAAPGVDRLEEAQRDAAASGAQAAATLGQTVLDSLLAIAQDSENAEKHLKRLAMQLARMALTGALFGQGPLGQVFGGGLLAGLTGGGASASAVGNIVGSGGPVPLRRYAKGGIANSPHVALFGEGDRPEAFVPLPDGRTIPVTMRMPSMQLPKMEAPRVAMPAGGGGTRVVINDQRKAGSPDIRQERSMGADGMEELRLTIRDEVERVIGEDLAGGGPISRGVETTFGHRRRVR